MSRSRIVLATLVAAICAVTLTSASAGAPAPKPFLFWAGYSDGNVGRANLDGTKAKENLITGGSTPCGSVAVTRTYVYWSNYSGESIGRAKLDGSHVDQNFIPNAGGGPCGVVVYAGQLYWVNYDSATIGHSDLGGAVVETSWVMNTGQDPCGIAASGGYLYWGENHTNPALGRVSIKGTGLNASFIPNAGNSCYGVSVEGNHIYWEEDDNTAIARANLDGSNPNLNWLKLTAICGIATTPTSIYWGTYSDGTIGRANLNGSGVNDSLITNAPYNCGLGVGAPQTTTKLKATPSVAHIGKKVMYTATVTPLPDAGTVTFTAGGHAIAGCSKRPVSNVTGKATCTHAYATAGTSSVKATYSGDVSFLGSASRAVKQTVK